MSRSNASSPKAARGLRHKSFSAMLWSFAQRGGQQILRFGISVVLARILTPAEFGMVAMLTIFLVISERLVFAGFGSALVQKTDLQERDCSTVFLFNLGVSLACYGILFASAPAVAAFYRQPLLTPLLRVTALKLIIDALSLVQNSLLIRRMDYRTPTLISFVSVVVSGLLGIGLALGGAGVWSLVWMSVSQRMVSSAMLWLFSEWRLRTGFDRQSFRYCWNYGSPLLAGNLIDAFSEHIYDLVIGRVYTAVQLGYFTRGKSLEQIVTSNVIEPVRGVLFSAFSSGGGQRDRLRKAFASSVGTLALILAPAMVGLALLAPRVVPLLYSDRWAQAVPYLQLFCPIGFLLAFKMVCINVFKATGRTDLVMKLQIVGRSLSLISILVTWRWGIKTMLVGEICAAFLSWLLFAGCAGRLLGIGPFGHLRHVSPSLALSAVMGACVFVLDRQLDLPDFIAVMLLVLTGLLVYGGAAWWMKLGDLRRFIQTARTVFDRRQIGKAAA